jgi:hypothetical protein
MPLGPFTKKKKRKNAFFLFFTHNATNASKEQIEACEKKIDRINNKKRENTYKHGGGEQNGCEKKHRCGAFLVWFFFFFFFFFSLCVFSRFDQQGAIPIACIHIWNFLFKINNKLLKKKVQPDLNSQI